MSKNKNDNLNITSIFSLILFLSLVFNIQNVFAAPSDKINFIDPNFESLMRARLNKPVGDITEGDMASITGMLYGFNRQVSNIEGIQYAVNLTSIDLSSNKIKDVSPLSNLTKVERLDLSSNPVDDISSLNNLTNLKNLFFGQSNINDISVLSNMKNLENLMIRDSKVSDVSPLKDLSNLTTLSLIGNEINDISPLSNLTNLKIIRLDDNKIRDIKDLSNLKNLNEMYITNNEISDISLLENLNKLTVLNLTNNKVSDLSPINSSTTLKYLLLSNNNIKDISPLANLNSLISVQLSNNNIEDFSPLSSLKSISELNLAYNEIKKIPSLKNMTSLKKLYLNNNLIKDISPICDMMNLSLLYLANNQITSLPDSIRGLTNLEILDLSNNNLSRKLPVALNDLLKLKYSNSYREYTSFANNQLIGPIPEELKNRINNSLAFNGNFFENEPNQKEIVVNKMYLSIPEGEAMSNSLLKKALIDSDYEIDSIISLEFLPDETGYFDKNGIAIKTGFVDGIIKVEDILGSIKNIPVIVNILPATIIDKTLSNNSGEIDVSFSILDSLEITMGSDIDFGKTSGNGGDVLTSTATVTSSLPYSIKVKANNNFTGINDSNNIVPIEKLLLNIDNLGYNNLSLTENSFINNSAASIDKVHTLQFKLSNTIGHNADIYNSIVQFIIEVN